MRKRGPGGRDGAPTRPGRGSPGAAAAPSWWPSTAGSADRVATTARVSWVRTESGQAECGLEWTERSTLEEWLASRN